MPDPSDSKIQDLTDAVDVVDEPSDFPFRIAREPADAVVSSLDGRPELIETVGELSRHVATDGIEVPGAMAESASSAASTAQGAAGPIPMLVIQSPGGTMETRRPVDTRRFLVGTENCDLELEDGFVSRWHAQLFERDGALVLQDLASKNGVYLRIADDLALEDGDQIVIGEQRFEFRTSFDESEDSRAEEPAQLGAAWVGSPARLVRRIEGGLVGGVHPIGKRLTIGASEGDICFPEDTLLASPHAVIRREQDRYLLRDVDSDTGTFIRIANAVELIDGDCFLVGRTRIRLTFA